MKSLLVALVFAFALTISAKTTDPDPKTKDTKQTVTTETKTTVTKDGKTTKKITKKITKMNKDCSMKGKDGKSYCSDKCTDMQKSTK